MLMKTPYLTASQLNLTEEQREALVNVLSFLRTVKFKHNEYGNHKILGNEIWFSMKYWYKDRNGCGTVMCIGGTAEWLADNKCFSNKGDPDEELSDNIWDLFYPNDPRGWNANPHQAADVLEHFLLTGNADWGVFADEWATQERS